MVKFMRAPAFRGITTTIFVVGLIAAILIASFISIGLSSILNLSGTKGEKGDKGDTGATGPAGPAGPQGPQGLTGTLDVPIVHHSYAYHGESNETYPNFVDIVATSAWDPLIQISVNETSNLVIIFQTYLRLTWSPTTLGWARIDIRALVDSSPATPDTMQGIEAPSTTPGQTVSSHAPFTGIFYQKVQPGTHSIRIQWDVFASNQNGNSAYALQPELIVYALPSK